MGGRWCNQNQRLCGGARYGDQVGRPPVVLAHCALADVGLILGTTLAVQPFQNCALAPEHLAIINVERPVTPRVLFLHACLPSGRRHIDTWGSRR